MRDAHCHPLLGGGGGGGHGLAPLARCPTGDGSGRRCPIGDFSASQGRSGSESGGGSGDGDAEGDPVGGKGADPLSAAPVIAGAIVAILPNLTQLRFTGSTALFPSPMPPPACRPGVAVSGGGGGRNHRAGYGGGPSAGAAADGGRALLTPQPLLQQLAAALLQLPRTDLGGASIGGGDGSGRGRGSGSGGSVPRPVGLQALCVDYSDPSVDAFEAELLDHHYPRLPLLLLDFHGAAAAPGCAAAAAAAVQHPILRHHPAMQRPGGSGGGGGAAAAGPPLLQLTSLELRGVAVQPGLLSGLRHLAALTRLVLSVSCPRPYEPLVTSLPYMTRLAHLHLFLHVPPAAAARQLAGSCRARHRGGGGGDGLAEDGFDDTPDCTAIQLAAVVSQCRRLVSLGLPGEDVGGQMPAVLQALPGLTHLAARQLCPWELAAPHTALRSLSLSMTWPAYLAPLLTSLPRLNDLAADMYIHADACGGGGDGGGEAAEQLYDEVLAVASAARGARRVELQLSVMRGEGWEWGRLVRLLGALRGLAVLTLRMPQRDSGPPLRAQHFVGMCRQLTGLRRLTLLLAHPSAAKLNAKALQAIQHLPHIQTVQLHLGGVWEGHRVPADGEDEDGGGSTSRNGRNSNSSGGAGGGRSNRSRFRSGPRQAAAGEAAATSHSRPKGRSGRSGKPQGCRRSGDGGDDGGGGSSSNIGGPDGHSGTAALAPPPPPPPLPGSAAARAVLEAARGLGCRGGGRLLPGPRRGPRVRRGSERRLGGGVADASGGASSVASDDSSAASDDASGDPADDELDCADAGRCGGGSGQRSSSGGGGGGGVTAVAAAAEAVSPAMPVQLQVDFLTAREAAEVNAVLRWEGRPAAVVRAGLQPRWVWAEFAGGRGA